MQSTLWPLTVPVAGQLMVADASGAVRLLDISTRQAVLTLHADVPMARAADWHPLDPLRYRPRRSSF